MLLRPWDAKFPYYVGAKVDSTFPLSPEFYHAHYFLFCMKFAHPYLHLSSSPALFVYPRPHLTNQAEALKANILFSISAFENCSFFKVQCLVVLIHTDSYAYMFISFKANKNSDTLC